MELLRNIHHTPQVENMGFWVLISTFWTLWLCRGVAALEKRDLSGGQGYGVGHSVGHSVGHGVGHGVGNGVGLVAGVVHGGNIRLFKPVNIGNIGPLVKPVALDAHPLGLVGGGGSFGGLGGVGNTGGLIDSLVHSPVGNGVIRGFGNLNEQEIIGGPGNYGGLETIVRPGTNVRHGNFGGQGFEGEYIQSGNHPGIGNPYDEW